MQVKFHSVFAILKTDFAIHLMHDIIKYDMKSHDVQKKLNKKNNH